MVIKGESNKDDTNDLKSLWKSICDEVKETHDINLNKLISQLFLILIVIFAISSILSLNIGSNVETKGDSLSDSGNYNIKTDGLVQSRNIETNNNMISSQSSNGYTTFNLSSPIRNLSYVFNTALGSTMNWISLFILLAIVGLAMSFTMGILYRISWFLRL